ncbi:SRPBCC family protein [Nonlabens antarcticus]|uniref:SRPBCC family protein n=1 Tax=Nonlabens antarcticus TaxID=392714 RepID=UPI001891B019|nr:SRPBCC family protein [Nonlabens antarcticus]
MPEIILHTTINAPIELVFDLARSIDLHQSSLKHTKEKAIAGRVSGLVEEGETVTWQARHFMITQHLTSLITDVKPPHFFADEMVSGAFKRFRHEHHFSGSEPGVTTMKDIFDYDSPLGILGKLADRLFLKRYMTSLLEHRNKVLKKTAEDGSWRELPGLRLRSATLLP